MRERKIKEEKERGFVEDFTSSLNRMPLFQMLNIRRNFDRLDPSGWIFFFAVIAIIMGAAFVSLQILAWIGLFIVIAYLIYFIAWYYSEK